MEKYILSAFADEYCPELEKQLIALGVFGITHTELRFADKKNVSDMNDCEIDNLKSLLDKYGIKVNSIGSPLGKITIDGDLEAHLKKTERVCHIAKALGAPYVRMFSFYPPKGENILDYKDKVFETVGKMIDIAEKYGVRLCHENEAKIFGEQPENCLELLEYFGGRLGCVFDMGNFALEGYDPMAAYRLLCPYIDYFHIKDALGAGAIVPPGKGEARIEEILGLFAKNGRQTFVTLEPLLQTFSGLNALTDRGFENPYKYDTLQDAFADAVDKIKEILERI
jgi:sugar phosphate isomerase/epimerase